MSPLMMQKRGVASAGLTAVILAVLALFSASAATLYQDLHLRRLLQAFPPSSV